jgi:hypothetical protein
MRRSWLRGIATSCLVLLAGCPLGRGDKPNGDPCKDDNDCVSGSCARNRKVCSPTCARDSDFESPLVCADIGASTKQGRCDSK